MSTLIPSVRIFLKSAWLSYVALFAWSRPASYLAGKVFCPLGMMLFFVYLGIAATGRDNSQFYIVGNAVQMVAINAVFGITMIIGGERDGGTLIYLVGSPCNRIVALTGRAFFSLLDGMLTVVMCFAWGMVLGLDLSAANLPGLAVTILISTISASGLGLLMGSVALLSVSVMFLDNLIYFLLLIFNGSNLAIAQMPQWMQTISSAVPLTRSIQSARLLAVGAPLTDVLPLLGGEVLIGLVYALAGFAVFRAIEFRARQLGTLEAF